MTFTTIPANVWLYLSMSGLVLLVIISYRLEIINFFKFVKNRFEYEGHSVNPNQESYFASRDFQQMVVALMFFGMLFGFGLYHKYTRVEYEYIHPTMSKAEQKQAIAKCELQGIERFGDSFQSNLHRPGYERACLMTKGFEEIELVRQ